MKPEDNTIASTGFAVLTATAVPFTFLYEATITDVLLPS
jgi:type I restriction enzyme S subunit